MHVHLFDKISAVKVLKNCFMDFPVLSTILIVVTFEACFFASSLAANNAEAKGSVETTETLATLLKGSLSPTEKQLGA